MTLNDTNMGTIYYLEAKKRTALWLSRPITSKPSLSRPVVSLCQNCPRYTILSARIEQS